VIFFWNPLFCQKLLYWYYSVRPCVVKQEEPETEGLLDEFFEANETILPHNNPYSPSDLVEHISYEWFPDCRTMWPTSLLCLRIILVTAGLIIRYHSGKQGTIIIQRLSKLLTSLQSEGIPFTGHTVRNKPSTSSTKILRIVSLLISGSYSIIWRAIRPSVEISFRTVSIMSVIERLLVVHCVRHLRDFHGSPESLHNLKNIPSRKPVLSAGRIQ
jgi:hypothetical protein